MPSNNHVSEVLVGLCSRIDYGSPGYRQWLVNNGFETFRRNNTQHNLLVGGLVSGRDLNDQLKEELRMALKDCSTDERANVREQTEREFITQVALELSKAIPKIQLKQPVKDGKKHVPLFIMTSPAFDLEIGERVARELIKVRDDIVLLHPGSTRLSINEAGKDLWALTPVKGVWMRGDYFSTPAERVIKDKINSSSQHSPDRYIVGCFGSSLHKEKGEHPYAYDTVPVLHRLEGVRVNENQIGVRILVYLKHLNRPLIQTHSFKRMVANELEYITPPKGFTRTQERIVQSIIKKGYGYNEQLAREMGISYSAVERQMKILVKRRASQGKERRWPGLRKDTGSGRYYFNLDWLRFKLKCPLPDHYEHEDRIVVYGCLHAGSVETDYEFFVNDVPKVMLDRNVNILVGAGDLIEGMAHNLDRKREILPGCNNNMIMEEMSAKYNSTVLLKVFETRVRTWLLNHTSKPDNNDLLSAIRRMLPQFYYIPGNHDLWQAQDGALPLKHFHQELVWNLTEGVREIFSRLGHPVHDCTPIVEHKVALAPIFTLPSGLRVKVQHPHMSRAKTTSIRPQEMMSFAKREDCKVSLGANFHVSMNMEEYDMDMGQCISHEIGTIKHGSNFERNKLKTVDQGVGYLRILSSGGEILVSESAFFGAPRVRQPFDSLAVINDILKSQGVGPLRA
jgi:hypothetical protein